MRFSIPKLPRALLEAVDECLFKQHAPCRGLCLCHMWQPVTFDALQREEAEAQAQEAAAAAEKERLASEAGALAGTAGALGAPLGAAAVGRHHAVKSVLDSTLEDSESDSDTEASQRWAGKDLGQA